CCIVYLATPYRSGSYSRFFFTPPAHSHLHTLSLHDALPILLDGERPTDLTALKHFTAPDDGNPDDETVLAVPLPQPVPPEGSITIEVLWSAHVPRTFARTGAIGKFFFIAQWFPKLGVLQDQ